MKNSFKKKILSTTRAKDFFELEEIQDLWSGYGKILRYGLTGADLKSIIVKNVRLPNKNNHPRGWSSNISHQRKLKSYKVEMAWYKNYSINCTDVCRVPKYLALDWQDDEFLMVLEDLDASGFPERKNIVSWNEIETCLTWLANFHAVFMGVEPEKLWKQGTYWHLDTRPDELKVLNDEVLKKAAGKIDQKLKQARFKTFVHGDAKLANFCFSPDCDKVAAVDFQYVGGGCGMKDVAYFTGSCLNEDECDSYESDILNFYFQQLRIALTINQKEVDVDALEQEWRMLYPVAWTDFHRFFKGWSPGHWKASSYSERVARDTIEKLQS